MKINCLEFVEKVRLEQDLSEKATLVVIQVGENPASELYVKSKVKEAEKWNVDCHVIKLHESIKTEELVGYLYDLYRDMSVDGVIVQLPLPEHIDEQKVLNAIHPCKNVDGFKQTDKELLFEPCTPMGIMMLLESLTDLEGKMVTLIGRGKTVGEPLRDMLLAKNCTLAVCHSHSAGVDLSRLIRYSGIVISAAGVPNLFEAGDFHIGSHIVIDAGISRINGKQVGDFSHDNLDAIAYHNIEYTPWTNGVGKLTVMALMLNVRKAHEMNKRIKKGMGVR